jgi:formate C-acetyltransferase
MRMGNGTLLNLKLSPNVVAGEVGRNNLIRFLETLVKLRVCHIQLTLQDRKTLLEAQAHPENYKDLLVRVAAYSAYFTRLSPKLQEEVISRHEHDSID